MRANIDRANWRVKRSSQDDSNKSELELATRFDGHDIRPESRLAYIDTLVFVLPPTGLPEHCRAWLDRHQPRLRTEWLPMRGEGELWLYHPISPEVAEYMARLMSRTPGLRQRRVDVALDLIFATEGEKDRARRIFDTYSVVPRCRTKPTRERHGTTYAKKKRMDHNLVIYSDRDCRVTGEVNCIHIEARLKGGAIERHRVTLTDITRGLDLRSFWRERVRMAWVEDRQRLGRMWSNANSGQRRRKSIITTSGRRGTFRYDHDTSAGNMITNIYRTTQELITQLRKRGINPRDALREIDTTHLLPTPDEKDEQNQRFWERNTGMRHIS